MLQFILGRAATGRTFTIMDGIKKDVLNNKKVVLIIPEQFSFEWKRAILKTLGDEAATNVDVLSFSRIYDEVNRLAGGNAFSVMNDCDKIITMRSAMKAVENELCIWKRYVDSDHFASILVQTVDELKTCAITPDQLISLSENGSLGRKINDIYKIYNAYEGIIYNKFIDPSDKLTHLYNKLLSFEFFKDKEVFIDSFKDFTGQQYKILERIFSQANNVTISILCDGNFENKLDIFSNIRTVKSKIEAIASKYNIKKSEDILLQGSKYSSDELKLLEGAFCDEKCTYDDNTKDITLFEAKNIYDEAEFVARNIRRMVRSNGYRYNDFVIIARETADYENAVISACKKNNVGLFFDAKEPINTHPVCTLALSALAASNKMMTSNIFKCLKTGLTSLNFDDINELENYVNIWSIDGNLWYDEWKMNPKGFRESESTDEKIIKQLDKINEIRVKTITPLLKLKKSFGNTAKEHSEALFTYFNDCNLRDNLIKLEKAYIDKQDIKTAEFFKQGYEAFINIIDSVIKCLGDVNISCFDFINVLSLAINSTSIGTIPQMLDQVTFGAADRIRPSRPKVAFVLGMNQGVFPKIQSHNGVFAAFERRRLIDLGINLNDNNIKSVITENLLVYTSLCCPSDKLYISYTKESFSGEILEPSTVLNKIKETFSNINFINKEDILLNEENIPETSNALLSEYCLVLNYNKEYADIIKSSAENFDEIFSKINNLENKVTERKHSLSSNVAKELYGNEIKTSATDFEIFHRCKFAYFCRYGLRLKKLQPAGLDVMQRGTIIHFVLEKYISKYKNSLCDLSDEQIKEIVLNLIAQYFSLIPGFEQAKTERFDFLSNIITESVYSVVIQVTKELIQSDFIPEKCELSIGNDGDVPSTVIKFNDSSTMKLQGKIDRVDVWNGYIRIIDYKTGSKIFKLPDIIYGLNMQMLIYLFALIRGDKSIYKNMIPAGILYMPSSKKLGNDKLAMNGLLVKDEMVHHAMEKENNGEFVPKMKFNKDGTISDSDSYIESNIFDTVFDYISYLFAEMGREIHNGNIDVSPLDDSKKTACNYCDFAGICQIEDKQHTKVNYVENSEAITIMKGSVNNGV